MIVTTEQAPAVIRFCEAIWKACPWAAPEGWSPAPTPDIFAEIFGDTP